MNNVNNWIEHLQHPLVLAGCAVFLLALLFRMLGKKKYSSVGMYIGLVALLTMITVVVFNWNSPNSSIPAILIVLQVVAGAGFSWPAKKGASVDQSTGGDQSAAINTNGKVSINFNYGGSSSGEKSPANEDAGEEELQGVPGKVSQRTQGEKSPAVNTKDDVEISYGE